MSDDTTTKPEQPPSERHWLENLGRLDIAHKPERLAIMAALLRHIGSQQKALDTCRAFIADRMSPGEKSELTTQIEGAIGRQVSEAMDYTIARLRQLPGLDAEAAAACASTLASAAQAWGNLGLLLDMRGKDTTAERNVIRQLGEECQEAHDGWRAKQPATNPQSDDEDHELLRKLLDVAEGLHLALAMSTRRQPTLLSQAAQLRTMLVTACGGEPDPEWFAPPDPAN